MMAFAKEVREKKDIKAWAKKKKEFQKSDLRIRKEAAKKACHAYIRERDKDKLDICCNKPLKLGYHAGHFLESGNNPLIRYDEDNIHGQNVECNYFKGGNSADYEKNLRIRIGDEAVEKLKRKKGGTMKRTSQDLMDIEIYYKWKLKELKNA